jgi:Flp pilus assembly protein TadB
MKFNIFKRKENSKEPQAGNIQDILEEKAKSKKEIEEVKDTKKFAEESVKAEALTKEKPENTYLAESAREKKANASKPKFERSMEWRFKKLKSLRGDKLFPKKKKKFLVTIRGFVRNISLQEYLEKAGLESLDAKLVTRKIFRINIFISLAISFFIILYFLILQKGLVKLLVFLLGFWLTGFFLLLGIIWATYLFYLDMKIFQRTKAVEEVFPDFLQLTSANISAGMPIDKALWYAVRPGFGVLAKEIETVAKNTMAGEDLSVALTNFSRKYNSKTIQRSISLLLEGMSAGGEMADLLNKIALNIDENKILRKEMAANVTTYVIFITFATIAAAPVLFGLATQLLVIIKQITSKLGSSITTSGSFFSFSFSSDAIKANDFILFSYLMLTISAISSACIVSVIKKGRVKEGLTKIPVFIIVSLVLYTLSTIIISSAFGNFL